MYINKILEWEDKTSKKRKIVDNNQLTIIDFHNFTRIPNARVIRINRALAKFFIACNISFQIVENPFFINFVKELNSAHELPTREYLSNKLLERELAKVNLNVAAIIEKGQNFTLGLLII